MSGVSVAGVSRMNILLGSFFKPTYRPRRISTKGAALSLFWGFSLLVAWSVYFRSMKLDNIELKYQIGLGCITVAFPIAGYLGDAYFGRYRVVKYSMVFAWLATIVYVAILILQTKGKAGYLVLPALGLGFLSFAACQANFVQFGVDQLADASSNNISSYVSWYAWAYFLSDTIGVFSQQSMCKGYIPGSSFIAPALLTLCLCSDIFFGDAWLIKEPVVYNPLSMIFRVLGYAVKNKCSRQSSVFSYRDHFSTMDLAKNKYGGPFTAEQVEDVKTFLRILLIIVLGSLYIGLVYVVGSTANHGMIRHYQDPNYVPDCSTGYSVFFRNSLQRSFVRCAGSLFLVVFIPIFEFLIYPLFWKCMPSLGIMKKFVLGMFLYLLYSLSLMGLEVIGHTLTSKRYPTGSHNVTCLFEYVDENSNGLVLDFRWIALTKNLNSIGIYFLMTSTIEFICAQSPYSMKGLLGGLIYTVGSLSVLVSTLTTLPFRYFFKKEEVSNLKFGCGIWYFMVMSVISLVFIIVAVTVTKCYSHRRRDDVHNEPLFAVDNYD